MVGIALFVAVCFRAGLVDCVANCVLRCVVWCSPLPGGVAVNVG